MEGQYLIIIVRGNTEVRMLRDIIILHMTTCDFDYNDLFELVSTVRICFATLIVLTDCLLSGYQPCTLVHNPPSFVRKLSHFSTAQI